MIIERTPLNTSLPVALATVADHCRVELGTPSDFELSRMTRASAQEFEDYAQVALLTQTITVTLEAAPGRSVFPLPIGPVIDPLSVQVTAGGAAFEGFAVITGKRPALRFTDGKPCGVVVIEYEAGFGDLPTHVPPDIQNAVCDQVAALFDGRGIGDGKGNGMSPHMARVAARYRRVAV